MKSLKKNLQHIECRVSEGSMCEWFLIGAKTHTAAGSVLKSDYLLTLERWTLQSSETFCSWTLEMLVMFLLCLVSGISGLIWGFIRLKNNKEFLTIEKKPLRNKILKRQIQKNPSDYLSEKTHNTEDTTRTKSQHRTQDDWWENLQYVELHRLSTSIITPIIT